MRDQQPSDAESVTSKEGRCGVGCAGRIRQEGQYYKVYHRWTYFVGHLRREGGQYKVYKGWTDLVGSVELDNTVQVAPLLLSGGAALRLLL